MSFSEDTLFQGVVALLIITWLVSRQLRARPIRDRISLLPILLLVFAFVPPGPAEARPLAISMLVLSALFSAVMGYLRGKSMHVWLGEDGQVWRQGTPITVGLWVLTIAIRLGFEVFERFILDLDVRPGAIWLSLAITLVVQSFISLHRTIALKHAPSPTVA